METVSYLTINDETKEIVDLVSRNTIEDIGAIVSTHDNNIKQLQLNMSPGGALPATIEDAQQNARDAYEKASSVEELIQAVDDKTVSIEQTANNALSQANTAQNKADYA
jgi:methyl-accepting chemotaxis protein